MPGEPDDVNAARLTFGTHNTTRTKGRRMYLRKHKGVLEWEAFCVLRECQGRSLYPLTRFQEWDGSGEFVGTLEEQELYYVGAVDTSMQEDAKVIIFKRSKSSVSATPPVKHVTACGNM